jgi:prophage regulatory protein
MDSSRLLRLPQVAHQTGLSRSTIYALIQRNHFPRQIKLTTRAVGWESGEIDRWIQDHIGIRDEALRPAGEQLILQGIGKEGVQAAPSQSKAARDAKGGVQ